MKGGLLLIAGAAAAAWYFGAGEEVEDTVTQNIDVDAYTQFDALMQAAAARWGVPSYGPIPADDSGPELAGGPGWWLMKAVCWVESDLGRARSVAQGLETPSDVDGSISSDGLSWGLFQVTLATAADFRAGTTAEELNDPNISAELGARILARNSIHFPGNLEFIVRAYNGGLGFQKTRSGQQDTPVYWKKVRAKLAKIESKGG